MPNSAYKPIGFCEIYDDSHYFWTDHCITFALLIVDVINEYLKFNVLLKLYLLKQMFWKQNCQGRYKIQRVNGPHKQEAFIYLFHLRTGKSFLEIVKMSNRNEHRRERMNHNARIDIQIQCHTGHGTEPVRT